MRSEEIDVRTGDRMVTDLTARATQFCAGAGDGLLSAFVAPSLVVPVVQRADRHGPVHLQG